MTEEEAKTKWCPFVRSINGVIKADGSTEHSPHQTAYNRIIEDGPRFAFPKAAGCAASGCMAWRWDKPQEFDGALEGHGYCGLAGAPQ